MSAIDYKALAERVAQRAIYADNNADPNNKAWAADLRAVVSLLNGMADAQPVGYATANGMRMLQQDDATVLLYKHDYLIRPDQVPLYTRPAPAAPQAEPKREPLLGELMREQRQSRIVAGAYPDGNPNAGAMMAQTRQAEPTREPTGAPYGIIDPDYGRVYTIARKLAWEEGYAIGLHGSFTRDLDLIAVPWTDTACEPEHLIRRIVDATGLKLRDGVAVKPHGRRAWTLLFPAFGDPRFVDLSVMPRIGGSDAE